jgi:hypothetical protein
MSGPNHPSQPPTAFEHDEDEASAVRFADLGEDERVVSPDEDEDEDEGSAVRFADLSEDERAELEDEDEATGSFDTATAAASNASSTASSANSSASSSGGTSGGTARGVDELAIEKWSEEQKKVYESVKSKTQELGISKSDVERIAAFSVLAFMHEKNARPDTRVDRVQAVNANGDLIVRMEHMKYGDREPIFNNDVRLKDAPAFEQTAAQIQQANERVHGKTRTEQEIAQHQQNQVTNQDERPNPVQLADDQITARVQSSMSAIGRGGR